MKSTLLIFVVVLGLVIAPTVSDAAKPIMNLKDVSISVKGDGTSLTIQEVQAAIINGCRARRWSPGLDGEGMIRATINVRSKHFAEIEIPFTSTSYSIIYVSSKNLDYNASRRKIHRNYNNWVVKLSATIDRELRKVTSNSNSDMDNAPAGVVSEKKQDDVYAELIKLDDLRNRGILTDDEFEAEKRKLLGQD